MARQGAQQWTRQSEHDAVSRIGKAHLPVLVYTRQSSTDFGSDGTPRGPSLDAQLSACSHIAELAGCPVEHFQDADRSGRETSKRPGYLAMIGRLRGASPGSIGAVFCYDQDRLHRNVVEFYRFMEECEERGVLVFDAGGLVRNEDELAWGIKAVVAAVERKKIARRVRDNLHHLMEQGRLLGHAPVGYRRPNGHGPLEIDPETAPLVGQVFELYATGRFSVNTLARHLNESGVAVPQNRDFTRAMTQWQRSGLKDLLKNVSYTGKVVVNGQLRRGMHPALIDDELFDKCQKVRLTNLRRRTQYRFHRNCYPLQAFLICARCGGRMHGRNRPELGRYWYICANRRGGACTLPWVPGDLLEQAIGDDLRRFRDGSANEQLLDRLGTGLSKAANPKPDLERTLKTLDAREQRVKFMWERGDLDQADYVERISRINLERAEARQQGLKAKHADISWAERRLADVVSVWRSAEPSERAAMVGEIYQAIEVDRTETGIEVVATPQPLWTPFFDRMFRIHAEYWGSRVDFAAQRE